MAPVIGVFYILCRARGCLCACLPSPSLWHHFSSAFISVVQRHCEVCVSLSSAFDLGLGDVTIAHLAAPLLYCVLLLCAVAAPWRVTSSRLKARLRSSRDFSAVGQSAHHGDFYSVEDGGTRVRDSNFTFVYMASMCLLDCTRISGGSPIVS